MNRTRIQKKIYCKKLGKEIKAFPDISSIKEIINNAKSVDSNGKKFIVKSGMEYRLDKISCYYLGSEKYAWMIYYANYTNEGLKFFSLGKEIKMPDITKIY